MWVELFPRIFKIGRCQNKLALSNFKNVALKWEVLTQMKERANLFSVLSVILRRLAGPNVEI